MGNARWNTCDCDSIVDLCHAPWRVKMKTRSLIIAAAALLAVTGAQATTYGYLCKVDGKMYPLQVNDTNMSLKFREKQYGLNDVSNPDVCGKGGWHAEGNGTSFDFCY